MFFCIASISGEGLGSSTGHEINCSGFCRPSASELLKHPFIKKAKNKEFLKDVVLGDAPSLTSRAKKVCVCVCVCVGVCVCT